MVTYIFSFSFNLVDKNLLIVKKVKYGKMASTVYETDNRNGEIVGPALDLHAQPNFSLHMTHLTTVFNGRPRKIQKSLNK